MKSIVISGARRLQGEIRISGAKNAAVAILPASLLANSICRLENIPDITDMALMYELLETLGVKINFLNNSSLEIDSRNIHSVSSLFEGARNMRASCYLLGALLARFGYAKIPLPGGCNFGVRPIDQHIKGFEALGAKCIISDGCIEVSAIKLLGANIYLDVVSVGATINIMLAAVSAEGITTIENAAKEPHVVDVANFLNKIGADIMGAGTDIIKIKGVTSLHSASYSIIPDQIEAGTFMACAFASFGDITLTNIIPKHLEAIVAKFEEMGAHINCFDDALNIKVLSPPKNCNIKTMPYPGFPTDMQPQIVSVLSKAFGQSVVNESVWCNRFRYVSELLTLGANISIKGNLAVIEGVAQLHGGSVVAHDLRAGAALIIAGLSCGETVQIHNTEYIERGYDEIVKKLSSLGACIKCETINTHVSETACVNV